MTRRRGGRWHLLLAGLAFAALPLQPLLGQSDSTAHPPGDSTTLGRPAGASGDTTPRDTLAKDTIPKDTTEHLLPVFPAATAPGPLPRGSRYVFTADSLVFSNAATLSDLLNHIPGVYVARGGYYGAPEPILYGGRGAGGLEIYWDGVPYLPLGRDSAWLDPARIPLAPLERVEVVVLPASLRVYLISARQRSTHATTDVNVKTGQFSTAGYRADIAKRWNSGVGLALGADYNNTLGDPPSTTTAFNSVDLWLKGEYIATNRLGVAYQIIASNWDRDPAGGPVERWKGKRSDTYFRAFYATRDDGFGFRAQAALAATTASNDTALADRSMWQDQFDLSETGERASAGFTATLSDRTWPLRFDARGAWQPLSFLTLTGDARHSAYRGGRHGTRGHLSAGILLPLGFSARADGAWANDLQTPALDFDTTQRTADFSGALRWDGHFASVEVGGTRRDPFQPIGFAAGIPSVTGLSAVPRTTIATFRASVRPYPGFELSGWYYNPTSGGADFEPPHHGRFSFTFDSKFWRVFRSGAFSLRGEYAVESWSRSTLGGQDTTGFHPLGGASFTEVNVQMRILGVTIFWMIRNNSYMRASYLYGADYPKNAQVYGVRWTFNN